MSVSSLHRESTDSLMSTHAHNCCYYRGSLSIQADMDFEEKTAMLSDDSDPDI